MKNLLRFETRKVLQRVSLYVILILALLMVLFSVLLPDLMSEAAGGDLGDELNTLLGKSADQFAVKALDAANIPFLLAILIALIITQDYREHTVKNIVSRGCTRSRVYFSKLLVCEILTVCFCMLCILTGWLAGLSRYGAGACSFGEILPVLAAQIVAGMTLCSFFVLLGMLMRSGGGALTVGILAVLFMPLLSGVIDAIIGETAGTDFTVFTDINVFNYQSVLCKLPGNESAGVETGGFTGFVIRYFQSVVDPYVSLSTVFMTIGVSVSWLGLNVFLGWLLADRQEL